MCQRVIIALLATACSGSDEVGKVAGCDEPVVFSTLPVDVNAIYSVTPIGNMGPPTHTLPTDHVGVYLNGTGIALVAPSAIRITAVRRTRYLEGFRQGESDYAVTAALCQAHELILGHIQTVVPAIEALLVAPMCEIYSTATETVESCVDYDTDLEVAGGEAIGTVGGPSAGAFDLGLYNTHFANYYANPSRYIQPLLTAVCPYDVFTADLRALLYARLGEGTQLSSGESPHCGSMSVDIAGTARGAWVRQDDPVTQAGDETNFAVLAPHPLYPESQQTFSLGPEALLATTRAGLETYPMQASGRVNRPFADISADGQVYCYVYDSIDAAHSYYVRLAAGDVLTLEKVSHAVGATPCDVDPTTWAFGAAAIAFVR